jgi:hypothetical protein
MISTMPFGRFGKPEELAKAVLYLASYESTWTVGSEIIVDGSCAEPLRLSSPRRIGGLRGASSSTRWLAVTNRPSLFGSVDALFSVSS